MTWGPFASDITAAERLARLRSLRALAMVHCREERDLFDALRRAEKDETVLAMVESLIEQVPTLRRRHLYASYAKLMEPERGSSSKEAAKHLVKDLSNV